MGKKKKRDVNKKDIKLEKKYKGKPEYFMDEATGMIIINKKKSCLSSDDNFNLMYRSNEYTRNWQDNTPKKEKEDKKDSGVKLSKKERRMNKELGEIIQEQEEWDKKAKKGKIYLSETQKERKNMTKTEKQVYDFFIKKNPIRKRVEEQKMEQLRKLKKKENKMGINDMVGLDDYNEMMFDIAHTEIIPKEMTLTRKDFGKGKKGKKAYKKHLSKMSKKMHKSGLRKNMKSLSQIYMDQKKSAVGFDNSLERMINDNSKFYIDKSNKQTDIEKVKSSKKFNKHIDKKLPKWKEEFIDKEKSGNITTWLNKKINKEAEKFLDTDTKEIKKKNKKEMKSIKENKEFYETLIGAPKEYMDGLTGGKNDMELLMRDSISRILL